ncbi:PREDICTED: uncharacterized protein LOC109211368 [Nicotiana attenuata]|uniref:PB1 domain-containing protein n=1 Tax=Nicotiana attenuata TaxID=49451 RepID=A0A314KJK4_NICAT|nr:PREDICTED: uncharacterized protein LOC109211368 [Nicotiana attenuata]OIT29430.1 hypothetical protein A4A49_35405 [Nicotiana attenuata]
MENYSYTSYPESGDSSPRSREIDFDNTASWEDPNQIPNYKVKFMCSYGGKIHPRPHDNQLAYIGGETKILSVDRNTKFPLIISKLAAICDSDTVSFKYQLPGEDLDALISVTNDDDLEHMMHEYDRLYRASPKPARLRLFLFPANPPSSVGSGVPQSRSFGSEDSKSEKERFVDALNSGPIHASPAAGAVASPAGSADFLFGSEKGMVPPHVKLRDPNVEQVVKEPEIPVHVVDDRMIGTDPIQKHIQDLQRLHLEEQQNMYRRKSDDNLAAAFAGGHDYYVQKVPEKIAPAATVPGTVPAQVGYWQEKQVPGGVHPANSLGTEQPVYMIQAPAGAYHPHQHQHQHPQFVRPMAGPPGQGYYAVQRMPQQEPYRDHQPVYNVMPSVPQAVPTVPATLPSQGGPKVAGYSEGYGMVRPATTMGVGVADAGGYTQMAYDGGVGRQMYYPPQGGVMAPPPQQQPQYQVMPPQAVVSSDMRTQEAAKVVLPVKTTQASV